jgi:hypothetical protein
VPNRLLARPLPRLRPLLRRPLLRLLASSLNSV